MTTPSASLPILHHSNHFWSDPAAFRDQVPRLAVLLLNTPPTVPSANAPNARVPELFDTAWRNAEVTICADGGANHLLQRCLVNHTECELVPQYIKGDLDSLRDDVRQFYEALNTKVLHDPDQDSNDLDKCLQLLQELQAKNVEEAASPERFTVLIFGSLGGRLDQEMQSLNALFRWKDAFQQLVLLSDDATARLLLPGFKHVIEPNLNYETRTCGMIPMDGCCKSTVTTGLKWDLDGTREMRFGGMVSTSNHMAELDNDPSKALVTIECSHPLIWTTELKRNH